MPKEIIVLDQLSKNFGKIKAVDQVSINVNAGEIYALIGPNGAGKTTLIKMLVGLLSPDSGHASIAGHDIVKSPLEAKKAFGYVPDNPTAYDYLTGLEFLEMTGALNGLSPGQVKNHITKLAHIFPISEILRGPMGNYSRGNRQKTAFLASLMTDHQALIIDEPVTGLDPDSITTFGRYLTGFVSHSKAVFLVTHTLSFAQKYASRVGILSQGKLVKEVQVQDANLEELYSQIVTTK